MELFLADPVHLHHIIIHRDRCRHAIRCIKDNIVGDRKPVHLFVRLIPEKRLVFLRICKADAKLVLYLAIVHQPVGIQRRFFFQLFGNVFHDIIHSHRTISVSFEIRIQVDVWHRRVLTAYHLQ